MHNSTTQSNRILSFVASIAAEGVSAFEQEPSIENFLVILEAIGSHDDGSWVAKFWESRPSLEFHPQPVRTFLDWLGRAEIRRKASALDNVVEIPRSQLEVGGMDKSASNYLAQGQEITQASQFVQRIVEELRVRSETILDSRNERYGYFYAAYLVQDLLEDYFSETDPAGVIWKYLQAIYPCENDGDRKWSPTKKNTIYLSEGVADFLHHHFLPWILERNGSDAVEEPVLRAEQRATLQNIAISIIAGSLCNKWSNISKLRKFSLKELADILPLLPQLFFERVLVHINSFDSVLGDRQDSENSWINWESLAELMDVVLSLPVGMPVHSMDDLKLPYVSYLEGIADSYSLNASDLPYLPYQALLSLIMDCFDFCESEVGDAAADPPSLAKSISARLRHHRIKNCNGCSPWSAETAAQIGFWLKKYTIDIDIIFRLTVDSDFYWGADTMGGEESGPFASPFLPQSAESRFQRFSTQIDLVNRMIDEGWYEFANASCAFLLITQLALHSESLECEWNSLNSLLDRLREQPGKEVLDSAIFFAIDALRNEGGPASLQELLLRSRYSKPIDHLRAPENLGDWVINQYLIEEDLKGKLGNEVWMAIPKSAKKQLRDAEREWTAAHRNIGTRVGDFGALATSYVKVVEILLLDNLASVCRTHAFKDYWMKKFNRQPDVHLTLGPLLHMLKEFDNLPVSLQEEIKYNRIFIQDDKQLIKSLLNLMTIRNRGAHTSDVSDNDVVKIRDVLYGDQVLTRIIKIAVPQKRGPTH